MKISIAMASFNGEKFIKEQLDSFLSQTRLPDELVISDDGSTDSTLEIIKSFSQTCPFPIKVISNTQRLGITKNFENAMKSCTGDIIFLSDQDDVWLPEKISTLADVFNNNPKTGLVHCNAEIVNEDLASTGKTVWESTWFSHKEQQKIKNGKAFDVYLRHTVAAGMSMAVRADLLKTVLPIPDIFSIHDVWTALIIAAIADVTLIDQALLQYRVHGVNQTIGIHRLSLKEQFDIARKQACDNTFPNLTALHDNLVKRLEYLIKSGSYTIPVSVMNKAIKRHEHAHIRSSFSGNIIKKLAIMIPQIINGNYFRFSYGIKSIVKDLILR